MTTNWAGNVTYRAPEVQRPRTLDELRRIVAAAPNLRVLGSGHTFNHLADADEQLTLDGLPADVVIDDDCVSFNAGLTYGALAQQLEGRAALHNLASLPHISVAGAIATGTHGSGTGNLATAVRALQLVTSTGDIVEAERGDPDFDGMVVHLGRLGVVTRLTLDTEPFYEVAQRVFEGLSWEHVPDVFDAAYSVSVFTRWKGVDMVWLKGREHAAGDAVRRDARHGRAPPDHRARPRQLHAPARRARPVVGPAAALPHGLHAEQGRRAAGRVPAARASTPRGDRRAAQLTLPGLLVCELRTVTADTLWMSPACGRDTLAVHFTFEQVPIEGALRDDRGRARALRPAPASGQGAISPREPTSARRLRALAERLDPRGAFRP